MEWSRNVKQPTFLRQLPLYKSIILNLSRKTPTSLVPLRVAYRKRSASPGMNPSATNAIFHRLFSGEWQVMVAFERVRVGGTRTSPATCTIRSKVPMYCVAWIGPNLEDEGTNAVQRRSVFAVQIRPKG